MNFKQAGQKFGLTAIAVGRLYRARKALEQMKRDTEYGTKAKNEYFTLFEEVLGKASVKKWLGLNADDNEFTNTTELQQFYSWISPDDDDPAKRRRIHDPRSN